MKKRLTALLLAVAMLAGLTACGGSADTPTAAPSASPADTPTPESAPTPEPTPEPHVITLPKNEWERAVWYGFMPAELSGADPDKTVVTWKQYCAMLGNMIRAYDPDKLPEWEEMTKDAPDTEMKRDGAAIALLYAGRVMGIAQCNKPPNDFRNENYSWGEHYSWDYPIFEWNKETADVIFNTSDQNAIGPSFWYLMGRVSAITLEPMLDIDNGDPHLEEPLTLKDAAISVLRLYESVEAIALQTAEMLLPAVLETEEAQAIVAAAEQRKQEILNSPTEIVKSDTYIQGETYTGTAYYISNSGNDAADGKSPETAWATIDRLKNVSFQFGDAIFFERGGLWRKAVFPGSVRRAAGLTISAYGEGEKPRLYGSPENGAGAEKWTLYYEGENGEKIWTFYQDMPDCAAVILNGSTDHSQRILRDLAYWDGTQYLDYNVHSVPYVVEEQLKDMEVFTELPYEQSPVDVKNGLGEEHMVVRFYRDADDELLKGPLYVRCDEGNPGELYDEIEFICPYEPADGMRDYTTLDNLSVNYVSAMSFGGYWDGKSTEHVTIQNCTAGWLGGALCVYGTARNTTPFGYVELSGGGFNLNSSYETIKNCYVHHVAQDGINLETFDGDPSPCGGVVYRDNVVEYAMYGMGICNWETDLNSEHVIRDLTLENNYVLFCGFDSLYNSETLSLLDFADGEEDYHWPSYLGCTILDNSAFNITAGGENCLVSGNTFAFSVSHLIQLNSPEAFGKITCSGNTYAPLPGLGVISDLENPWGPLRVEMDVEKAVREVMGDTNGTIIQFD